jgi:tetratricopeptide (TPR) repeat protein
LKLDIPVIFSKPAAGTITKIFSSMLAGMALAFAGPATAAMPEYTAAEAKNHVGETATVVGKVDCIDHGRRHDDVLFGNCFPNPLLWVVVPYEVSGPEINLNELKSVTVAVSGKIESAGGVPQITIKSTSQIVPRTKLSVDYLGRARRKEQQGDLDGAIAEFGHAIDFNHEATAYLERIAVEQKKGDLDGAIADYDQLIQQHPKQSSYYFGRAGLKTKKSDFDGAIADWDHVIELSPRDYQAYNQRAEAREAKGDFAGAAADYRMASTILPSAAIYKTKLQHAQAEAKKAKGKPDGESAEQLPAGNHPIQQSSNSEEKELEAARIEFDQAVPTEGEAARLRYVTRLAEIYYRFLKNYWATGDKSANYATLVNAELKKHPAPTDSDSKKLSQLLIGKWQSPRHVYVFRANGKYGNEDGPVTSNWRIKGNQLIQDGSRGTIILLNRDYFIYANGYGVFFHSRVTE